MAGKQKAIDRDDPLFAAAEAHREARGTIDHAIADARREALLLFDLGDQTVGVAAEMVHEVVVPAVPVPLPQTPPHVLGLVLVGEQVMPQVDLASFLGLGDATDAEEAFDRMLVAKTGTERVAVLCGRVRGLVERVDRAIAEITVLAGGPLSPFLRGELHEGSQVVGVLDLVALLEAAAVR